MKQYINFRWAIVLLAAFLALTSFSAAVGKGKEQREQKTKAAAAMSQKVFKSLEKAQEFVEQKNYVAAHDALKTLRNKKRLSVYEKAQAWNYTAYTYYLQERYEDAIKSYQQVLSQGEIPEALQGSVLKTISQLYFVVGDYESALASVQKLIEETDKPGADVYLLLGQAHFQLEQYKEALEPIQTAVNINWDQGKQPKENWLLLLRVIHYELKDYKQMVAVLRELIELYPKDAYLMTLAAAYSQLGDTRKQLAITEALYEKGFMDDPRQAVNLANLYMLHGLPYKAAKVLESEMDRKRVEENEKNLRLLSQAWYQAREDEKTIPPLEKAAAMSQDGELYIRLAQSYMNLGSWEQAADAARKGLDKGSVRRPDTARVMLGMALFNEKKYIQARSIFQQALSDERSKNTAEQWLAHVDNEIKRRELLKQEASISTQRQIPPA